VGDAGNHLTQRRAFPPDELLFQARTPGQFAEKNW
jgi:hypothetical protein